MSFATYLIGWLKRPAIQGPKPSNQVPTTRILCPLPRRFRFATEGSETGSNVRER
jgi:hypothetical protein